LYLYCKTLITSENIPSRSCNADIRVEHEVGNSLAIQRYPGKIDPWKKFIAVDIKKKMNGK